MSSDQQQLLLSDKKEAGEQVILRFSYIILTSPARRAE